MKAAIESQYESVPRPKPKLPRYVERFRDRWGTERIYYRRGKGGRRIPLPHPDSADFDAAYRAAQNGVLLKELPRKDVFARAVGIAVRRATTRAKQRGMSCEVTIEWMLDQIKRQYFRCALSGIRFHTNFSRDRGWTKNPYLPSLDRIDNTKGYTLDNVRIVLSAVNFALNEWGEDVLREIAGGMIRQNPIRTVRGK